MALVRPSCDFELLWGRRGMPPRFFSVQSARVPELHTKSGKGEIGIQMRLFSSSKRKFWLRIGANERIVLGEVK
jgi:hypothetical protein